MLLLLLLNAVAPVIVTAATAAIFLLLLLLLLMLLISAAAHFCCCCCYCARATSVRPRPSPFPSLLPRPCGTQRLRVYSSPWRGVLRSVGLARLPAARFPSFCQRLPTTTFVWLWAPCIRKVVQVRVLNKKLSYEYPGIKTDGGSDLIQELLTGFSGPIF